jgi:hypothetical protein
VKWSSESVQKELRETLEGGGGEKAGFCRRLGRPKEEEEFFLVRDGSAEASNQQEAFIVNGDERWQR